MWSPTISSDELYHHGILKMKWGVRNGPPYPLQPSQHSAAEKKAMGKKAKKTGDSSGEGKAKRKFSLSEDQKSKLKKAAIGAAVVGGVALGAYAAYKLNDPDFKTIVKAARVNKSVDDYIKSMSDTEISKLAFNTKTQNLKISLNEARGMSPTAARKLVGRSDIQNKAWHEMTDRQMILDRLDAKAAGGYDKIERFTGGSQFMENAKKGKRAGNLAAQRLAEEAKKAKENAVYEKFKNNPNVKVYKNGLDMGRQEAAARAASKVVNDVKKTATSTTKAANTVSKIPTGASRTVHQATKAVKNTASNVKETAKKAASSGPKLEFGGPSSSSSSSDSLERLLKNSQAFANIAGQAYSASKKSTGQKDYTEQLLNKNDGRLKNMTMDDLKKLDLY